MRPKPPLKIFDPVERINKVHSWSLNTLGVPMSNHVWNRMTNPSRRTFSTLMGNVNRSIIELWEVR